MQIDRQKEYVWIDLGICHPAANTGKRLDDRMSRNVKQPRLVAKANQS